MTEFARLFPEWRASILFFRPKRGRFEIICLTDSTASSAESTRAVTATAWLLCGVWPNRRTFNQSKLPDLMSLEQLSYLAQLIAAVSVVASLIFVGFQIRHNTAALQRSEH